MRISELGWRIADALPLPVTDRTAATAQRSARYAVVEVPVASLGGLRFGALIVLQMTAPENLQTPPFVTI